MQTSADGYAVTRRAMDFEDYIDVARRHKGWIIGPLLLGIVASVVVAFLWPDTFISQAVIRVVPAQVPERFVASNVNVELSQRVNTMAQTILSRATLTNIIQTYGLYPREIRRVPIEDLVEDMRNKYIRIGLVQTIQGMRAGGVFPVSFSYENRMIAQKVTQDLVSRFINENTRERSSASLMTTEFLKEEVEEAKKSLDRVEEQLTEFRRSNVGRMPEERQANLSTLSALEQRLSGLNTSVSRVNQEKLLLESQIRVFKTQLAQAMSPVEQAVATRRNERLAELERQIQSLEANLVALKDHYKESHPDVKRTEANLALLRRQRDELEKQEGNKAPEPTTVKVPAGGVREVRELESSIQRLQGNLQAKDVELEDLTRDITNIDRLMKGYQTRIESIPLGEQRYSELMRDYEFAKTRYQELFAKKVQSELGTKMENRKQGETLEMLDPASLPQTPAEPKRWIIITVGSIAGLVLGFCMAGFREMKDTSLKNLKDVRAYTQLTVLGCVPLLENDLVVRRRRRLAWLGWSTACILGSVVISGSIYYYYSTKL